MTIFCQRHPTVPAVCDIAFPSCPLCEECRLELIEINGFDRTIPLAERDIAKDQEMEAELIRKEAEVKRIEADKVDLAIDDWKLNKKHL